MKKLTYTTVLFILFFLVANHFAQHTPSDERGDHTYRRISIMESNNIRTGIFNHTQTGRYGGEYPISVQPPYEWHLNTGQVYLALTQLFVGAEVTDDNGDVKHIIITGNYRQSPEGESWNFEPVPGYFNESNTGNRYQIASSKYPETWPESWPDKMNDETDPGWSGSWNSYFGKDYFINGEELYYKASDDYYDRFQYYPDSTDLTRKGLGLLVECRAFQFDEIPFQDMIFYSYKIKNDGTKPLNKMGVTNWIADFVGGDGDSQDDIVEYDTTNHFAWFHDQDGRAPNFGLDPVGMFGVDFLRTPLSIDGSGETGISAAAKVLAGGLNINSDETMWNDFMVPGNFFVPYPIIAGEYDAFFSSSYFDLMPGESEELVTSIIFSNGNTYTEKFTKFLNKKLVAEALYNANFQRADFELNLTNDDPAGEVISGTIEFSWNQTGTTGNTISFVYLSTDFGDSWEMIGIDSLGNKSITWNSNLVPDGVLNKLAVYTIDDSGYKGVFSSDVFTINNDSENAAPQIRITSPAKYEEVSETYSIEWLAGDAEDDDFTTEIFYKSSPVHEEELVYSSTDNTGSYLWNTFSMANSNQAVLKAVVYNDADTTSYEIFPFTIENDRIILEDDDIDVVQELLATGYIEYHVVDSTQLTGHTYLLEFDQTGEEQELAYNVYDYTSGTQLISNSQEHTGIVEGPQFDGMRLLIRNDPFSINENISAWNNGDIKPYVFDVFQAGSYSGINKRDDYQFVFADDVVDTSITIDIGSNSFESMPVYFTVRSLINDDKLPFGFIELDTTGGPGKLTTRGANRDRIVILDECDTGYVFTYWIYLDLGYDNIFRDPTGGDTLNIYQYKPFLAGDSIFFSTDIVNSFNTGEVVNEFKLYQNYPNPFNPSTKISFIIPNVEMKQSASVFTIIKIYDILGREVKTLLNKPMQPGNYTVEFNADGLASGVYIYRLNAGGFTSVKKMILLR
ncbi:MAG: T9SS type A sorting domain-containing protein [Melioribacteraceae bacterium]|nr:T9SS type A sorting domain-containing protein [Melioribacteraceae bacterium]MCF8354460.1 T9SS type A sorting domain-containing protein [Melioribacteraceae bacterium]MCF8394070.1 T9SS type A sorting domain-containing protein [Melioribacteraceae bacterium]MCF8419836.1 T9SS type A sorting domain-containing protein [Melioribacteraceae bacterium]